MGSRSGAIRISIGLEVYDDLRVDLVDSLDKLG